MSVLVFSIALFHKHVIAFSCSQMRKQRIDLATFFTVTLFLIPSFLTAVNSLLLIYTRHRKSAPLTISRHIALMFTGKWYFKCKFPFRFWSQVCEFKMRKQMFIVFLQMRPGSSGCSWRSAKTKQHQIFHLMQHQLWAQDCLKQMQFRLGGVVFA